MKIFDTHTHLNVEEFAGRETEELQLAKEMSVAAHNIVGFDQPTIERALELADSYDQLYATIGWHPTEAGTYDEAVEAYLIDKLRRSYRGCATSPCPSWQSLSPLSALFR